ncbi:MAG: hypothetical protein R6V50_02475 [Thermoplasmatota archaeon]
MIGEKVVVIFNSLKQRICYWPVVIFFVTALAVIIRSIPGWVNAAWGCDFGIYYGLTRSFVQTQNLFNPYVGWGSSYQYFPVLYTVTGGIHWLTGIELIYIMPKIAPIFGGLSVLIFYFVIKELLGDKKKAFFSMMLFAVMPFHVYQTSHASPLTVGHFFMMLSLYLFIRYRKDARFFLPLFISTILLIMSHHLTTYFYLISLVMIVFVENIRSEAWMSWVRRDVFYVLMASVLIFLYWIVVATPVYESFMVLGRSLGPIYFGSYTLILFFYFVFAMMFVFIRFCRKFFIARFNKDFSPKSALVKFCVTLSLCLLIMGLFYFVKLPWTNFSFTALSIIFAIPLLLVFSFSVAGFRIITQQKNGSFIMGWFGAVVFSLLFSVFTNTSALFPHRHFEYMMAPLSVISIFGISAIVLNQDLKKEQRFAKKLERKKSVWFYLNKINSLRNQSTILLVIILVLVTSNAISVYPSHVALNASYEAITNENLACIEWLDNNANKKYSIIASDHRLARVAEAIGFNTTNDEANSIWITEDFIEDLIELEGIGKSYSKISYIIIDDIMMERVVHVGFGQIYYMTEKSYEKFSCQPFELVYRNVTLDLEGEEKSWSEVYKLNWSYINTFLADKKWS